MSIKFKTLRRRNPLDSIAPAKFYAAVTANGSVDFETLSEMISEQSALSETDVLAVLDRLETNIVRELRQGRIVRLGKLGNFQVSLSSKGYETEEEVTVDAIKNSRILFRPTKKLRTLLTDLKFSRTS